MLELVTTQHPLRTMTLRYDRDKPATEFETLLLQYYHEIHDRTQQIRDRVLEGRRSIPAFEFQIEELHDLYREADRKFDHLRQMYDTNPMRDTVRGQLKVLLSEILGRGKDFVPSLIGAADRLTAYEDFVYEQDQWMNEVAFPRFSQLYKHYEECSLDLGFFDDDLEDFKYILGYVKEKEGRYVKDMDNMIDRYTDLNYQIDQLLEEVDDFDRTLLYE